MRHALGLLCIASTIGCYQPFTVHCRSDSDCPPGQRCVTLESALCDPQIETCPIANCEPVAEPDAGSSGSTGAVIAP